MKIEYPAFGEIVVDGKRYDHDVVIENGRVRSRDKGPSRSLKAQFGHTPLSSEESIPWSSPTLLIGSGYSGRLPITPELAEQAGEHDVKLVVIPTSRAVDLLNGSEVSEMNAILHVTC